MKKILTLLLLNTIWITTSQNLRNIETINDLWHFHKEAIEKPFNDDATIAWEKVELLHSWNTEDILDDEDGYFRGDGWYKKH
jgi:beta-galactosidase